MTPISSVNPNPVDMKKSFQASFRRGRRLAAILAVLTGGVFLASSLDNYLSGQSHNGVAGLFMGWIFSGWICWCVFRGGPLAGGCLLILSVPVVLVLLLGTLALLFNIVLPGGHFSAGVDRFQEIGSDSENTFGFLPMGVWAAYALWVLLISKDALLYRRARRRGIAEAEASAFEWPPAHRRLQP